MDYFSLENHQEKCRCCFTKLNRRLKNEIITEEIRMKFFLLTQIKLKYTDFYSNEICRSCDRSLKSFAVFKEDVSAKQRKLYEVYPEEDSDEDEKKDAIVWQKDKPETSQAEEKVDVDILEVYIKQETEIEEVEDEYFRNNAELLKEHLFENPEIKTGETLKETKVRRKPKTIPKTDPQKPRQLFQLTKDPDPEFDPEPKKIRKKYVHKPSKKICPECGKAIIWSLTKHIQNMHAKIPKFFCDLCGYKCLYRFCLKRHMASHLPKETREKFHCDFPSCTFSSVNKKVLKDHKNYHNPDALKRCYCGKTFPNKTSLMAHIRLFHDRNYKFQCSMCTESRPSKMSLETHMAKAHGSGGKHQCTQCNKSYLTDCHLRVHIRAFHTKEKTLKCSFEGCDKTFCLEKQLKKHEISHTKLMDQLCDQCPAAFNRASCLREHKICVHLGWRVHCQMPGCTQVIRRRKNLRKHLAGHHKLPKESVNLMMRQAVYEKHNSD